MTPLNPHPDPLLMRVSRALADASVTVDTKTAVALSGGADSTAMLNIAHTLGLSPIALHCNFGLRGEESDRDERFIIDLCAGLGVELLSVRFDVAARRKATGESIEMACRELRYEWFGRIARERGLTAIFLGHHSNDNIETFMLNVLRGCGLRGTTAIPARRDIFIRPLLGVSRDEIHAYLTRNGLGYVTDSSNLSNDYQRNRLRNIILPSIAQSFPEGANGIAKTISNLTDDLALLDALVASKRREYVDKDGVIRLTELLADEAAPRPLLYHLLDGKFDRATIINITNSAANSGKYFSNRNGDQYLLDRGRLIPISPEAPSPIDEISAPLSLEDLISGKPVTITLPDNATLTVELRDRTQLVKSTDRNVAWFDLSLLDTLTPITLRHPRNGDRIIPFGMKGSRLLSDIFVENKIPDHQKKRQWVMTLDDKIIWLPELKNSNIAPVTPSSSKILRFYFRRTNKNS